MTAANRLNLNLKLNLDPGQNVCPVCCGKRVTGKLVNGEGSETITDEDTGQAFRILATIMDQPCRTCEGEGSVGDEVFAELTGGDMVVWGLCAVAD